MKFCIVGAGALGSIYAAYLARAGHEVVLVARGERAEQLARHGVVITGQEDFIARCDVVTEPGAVKSADVVVVAVKTYDTAGALAPLTGLSADAVFSVQNGMLKNHQLKETFGTEAVLGAVGSLGGEVLVREGSGPGPVRYTLVGPTILGELAGGPSERVERIVGALVGSGLQAEEDDDVGAAEWSKFAGWSGLSALAVMTRLPTYRFLSHPETALLSARVMRETGAVASKLGVALRDLGPLMAHSVTVGSETDAVACLRALGERLGESAPNMRQSILQDADRGRRLEVDETMGYTLELAQEHGVEVPTLELCCRIMRAVSQAASV